VDLELRKLWREYQTDPVWENAYRLLRANQRATGEVISSKTLELFARSQLIPVFMRAIERIHDYQYQVFNQEIDDEYDIYDNLQHAILLHDNIDAVDRGLIAPSLDPDDKSDGQVISIGKKSFTFLINLTFKDDLHAGQAAWQRLESVVLGGNLDNLQHRVGSITHEELRHYLRREYKYDDDYMFNEPWGYQGVLAMPKGEWLEGRDQQHLMLIYSFYPDEKLWNILIDMEFRGYGAFRRNPSVRVKTVLAWKEDIGQKTIRIPKLVRNRLGISLGDKVVATGPDGSLQLTAVIADPSEVGKKVAGLDAPSRRALGVELGQSITLSKPSSRTRPSASQPQYLFSYGSNNPDRLENVRLHHPLKGVTAAYLPDYKLCFLGYSNNWKGGVAGLKKKRGTEACGYVCQVSDDDLDILDIHEGVAGGYYYRKTLPVKVSVNADNSEFKTVNAVVYLPGPLRLGASEHFYPSDDYLSAVEETIFTFWDPDGECRDHLDEALQME
jgi:hypothetical protein